jgi:hypothetical protein
VVRGTRPVIGLKKGGTTSTDTMAYDFAAVYVEHLPQDRIQASTARSYSQAVQQAAVR